MTDRSKIKVYYNSACPVCNAGIKYQKNKDGASDIQWNDVHKHNELVSEVNADLEFVRERLHVVDEDNQLQVGFDAILAIWRNSPKEHWKATVLGLPGVKHLARVAYNVFAAALYKWNRSKKHW